MDQKALVYSKFLSTKRFDLPFTSFILSRDMWRFAHPNYSSSIVFDFQKNQQLVNIIFDFFQRQPFPDLG